MARTPVLARSVYRPVGGAHAVRVDHAVYTAAIGPLDAQGRLVGRADLTAQAEQVYGNLTRVLEVAGVGWEDVVKVHTYVAPDAIGPTGRRALQTIEDRCLPPGQRTGLAVSLPLPDPEWLIAVELIAHPGVPKQPVTGVPGVAVAPGWAPAVRVGYFIYLGAQIPLDRTSLGTDPDAATLVAGDTTTQIRTAYAQHGAILTAAGLSWDDAFKVQQYVTRRDLNLNDMQAARSVYLTLGRFLSTSVVCGPVHPQWALEGWLLTVDMEACSGPKTYVHAPTVWGNPKGPHAMKIGKTIYMHGQVARDLSRQTLHPDDARAQADLTYRNLDGVLKAAGAGWGQVVHVKTFCKHREDLAAVRDVRSQWLRDGHYTATDLVAAFFDPALLVEIELITVTD